MIELLSQIDRKISLTPNPLPQKALKKLNNEILLRNSLASLALTVIKEDLCRLEKVFELKNILDIRDEDLLELIKEDSKNSLSVTYSCTTYSISSSICRGTVKSSPSCPRRTS